MGRPEKSESRDLSPAVHTLFPIGEAGGTQPNVADAAKHAETMSDTPGVVDVQIGRQRCESCGTETFKNRCPDRNSRTTPDYRCYDCDVQVDPDEAGRVECPRCERQATCGIPARSTSTRSTATPSSRSASARTPSRSSKASGALLADQGPRTDREGDFARENTTSPRSRTAPSATT